MKAISIKQMPSDSLLLCYACNKANASHVCRYQSGELIIQICICRTCMQIETDQLLKETIGLKEFGGLPPTFQ